MKSRRSEPSSRHRDAGRRDAGRRDAGRRDAQERRSAKVGGDFLPKTVVAEVLDVVDGDTFVVRFRKRIWRVDLHHVDAPEVGQDSGYEAKLMLKEMLNDRWVVLFLAERVESRLSASVELSDHTDPEARLLKAGLAWARPGSGQSLRLMQEEARRKELGLWRVADPEPPWQFREEGAADETSRRH